MSSQETTGICPTCGTEFFWTWEEAFEKFGFDDGDGIVMTPLVAKALRQKGYEATVETWGIHNVVISELSWKGKSQFPESAELGYDDPREYLPRRVVAFLDKTFPNNRRVS